jgi:redox-sensitive bicupin YhaK (pirin superfamily)
MLQQTPGKIFLADERGLAESDRFRRFSTFNFGPWAHPHKGPFERLYGFNEETLAGKHALDFTVAEASHVIIIPITGAVALAVNGATETTVDVEETLMLTLPAGSVLTVKNPYAEEIISLLHVWLLAGAPVSTFSHHRAEFSFEAKAELLKPLAPMPCANGLPVAVSLGRFAGREEAVYQPSLSESRFFAFVLAGAFEVQGRLMHEKDGLALWNVAEVELEALSNDAVIIVLEF